MSHAHKSEEFKMSFPERVFASMLKEIVTEILRRCRGVYQIILYGSYARGDARSKSDVDLLIISEDPRKCEREATKIATEKGLPILHPVALSPDELDKVGKSNLYMNALLEGKILYHSHEFTPVKSAPDNYKLYLMVKYRAPPKHRRKLVGTTVVQRGYRMRARGLIEKMGGERIAPGLFIIPIEKWPPLEMIMQKLEVEYEVKKRILAPTNEER